MNPRSVRWLAAGTFLAFATGCRGSGGPRPITPTTLGTDLARIPRGRMAPHPWPGQDIAQARPARTATGDPATAPASAGWGTSAASR